MIDFFVSWKEKLKIFLSNPQKIPSSLLIKNFTQMLRFLIFSVLFSLSLPSFAGGPWLFPQKQGYIQFQSILPAYRYNSLLMGAFIKERQAINREIFNSDYSLYLEYGLTNKLNIIASLPFKYVSSGALTGEETFTEVLPEGSLFGLSNPRIAIKYGLVDKNITDYNGLR